MNKFILQAHDLKCQSDLVTLLLKIFQEIQKGIQAPHHQTARSFHTQFPPGFQLQVSQPTELSCLCIGCSLCPSITSLPSSLQLLCKFISKKPSSSPMGWARGSVVLQVIRSLLTPEDLSVSRRDASCPLGAYRSDSREPRLSSLKPHT